MAQASKPNLDDELFGQLDSMMKTEANLSLENKDFPDNSQNGPQEEIHSGMDMEY